MWAPNISDDGLVFVEFSKDGTKNTRYYVDIIDAETGREIKGEKPDTPDNFNLISAVRKGPGGAVYAITFFMVIRFYFLYSTVANS